MRRSLWICTLLCMAASPARAWDFSARFHGLVGQEFDSNATRVYGDRNSSFVEPDFLTRLILKAAFGAREGAHRLSLDYAGGAKLFYTQHDEHLLATRLQGQYSYFLPHGRSLGFRLNLNDTTQAVHSRDYTLFDGELFSSLFLGERIRFEAFAGGRSFTFKPDPDREVLKFSHLGPHTGLRLQGRFGKHWSAWLSYRFDLRFFGTPSLTADGATAGTDRQDARHMLGTRLRFATAWTRGKNLIVQGSYHFSANGSNSAGSSALWHRLQAVVSMQLPWDLGLHLMGTLQFTQYKDGMFLDKTAYEPDADENENALVLRLSWRMWDELHLVVQGSLYRNDFETSDVELPSFVRETLMLGLSWGAEL